MSATGGNADLTPAETPTTIKSPFGDSKWWVAYFAVWVVLSAMAESEQSGKLAAALAVAVAGSATIVVIKAKNYPTTLGG
jgi:hypothetical protein